MITNNVIDTKDGETVPLKSHLIESCLILRKKSIKMYTKSYRHFNRYTNRPNSNTETYLRNIGDRTFFYAR